MAKNKRTYAEQQEMGDPHNDTRQYLGIQPQRPGMLNSWHFWPEFKDNPVVHVQNQSS